MKSTQSIEDLKSQFEETYILQYKQQDAYIIIKAESAGKCYNMLSRAMEVADCKELKGYISIAYLPNDQQEASAVNQTLSSLYQLTFGDFDQ